MKLNGAQIDAIRDEFIAKFRADNVKPLQDKLNTAIKASRDSVLASNSVAQRYAEVHGGTDKSRYGVKQGIPSYFDQVFQPGVENTEPIKSTLEALRTIVVPTASAVRVQIVLATIGATTVDEVMENLTKKFS